jgi:hypothetical protein
MKKVLFVAAIALVALQASAAPIVAQVPEPSELSLLVVGLSFLGAVLFRLKKR